MHLKIYSEKGSIGYSLNISYIHTKGVHKAKKNGACYHFQGKPHRQWCQNICFWLMPVKTPGITAVGLLSPSCLMRPSLFFSNTYLNIILLHFFKHPGPYLNVYEIDW